ncbi:MAG: menaquinone biosynthesis protein [Acidobacteriota bacterium]
MKLRVSLVNYLNAQPLGWAFLRGPFRGRYDILPASPARCADLLSEGSADVGLIPSIEYQRIPGLVVLPGMSIAAQNRVRSILLVRRDSRAEVRSVALDHNSRTSAALLRLLLRHRMDLCPDFIPLQPDLAEMLRQCDAALVIGDAALQAPEGAYHVTDLGQMWREWQGKPFVFAFWACRDRSGLPADLGEVFLQAKRWGLDRLEEIALEYSGRLGIPAEALHDYLRCNIDYDLNSEHIEGLNTYYRLAHEAGLVKSLRPIVFI